MVGERPEEDVLRAVALRNATAILLARQQAEEALLQARDALEVRTRELTHSLSLMRATLEATADGILVTDSEGRVAAFNEACLRLCGLARESIQNVPYREVVRLLSLRSREPERLAQLSPQLLGSPTAEPWKAVEMTDGQVVEVSSHPQKVDGQVVGRVWSFRDVTDRNAAEDAFREEARVLDLLNRTGIAIASTLDLAALLQKVTDAATEMSGAEMGAFFYSTTDEAGESFRLYTLSGAKRETFEPFGQPRATPLFGPTFKGQPPVRCDDVLQDERYGRWLPHRGMPAGHPPVRSFLAVPVASRGGQPVGGLFFGHSKVGVFTERIERMVVGIAAQAAVAIDNARLLEETKRTAQERERRLESEQTARVEIARVSQLKDEFLATLSHELRTPLTAILGWAKLLLRPDAGSQLLGRGLETIERNAVAQARLIEDLLDMNRIISGKVRLNVQPTDLARVVEAAVDSIRPSADGKELRVTVRLDPSPPIVGDPDRLQQVVWNLLSNAVKFTPRGGSIAVSLKQLQSNLEVTVSDSGIGLSREFQPHAFDRFRQVDSSTTRSYGGLGLGLSIVKQLVELHGGSVRVTSDGEGLGSAFTVCLPAMAHLPHREDEHAAPGASRGAAPAGVNLRGLKILVVDDEDDTRDLIRQVLSVCGAEVHAASSAAEGLSKLQHLRPDLLVSDIGMPERDGYQFIRDVRGLDTQHGGKTPAVALTAYARSEDRTRAMLGGYQVHVSKPIDPEEFLATIASLAGRVG
ncbi:MAG: response regulator [Lautropia sp.]|nr:response regulator [Lautropia sp.]